jgi:DNA repair exonuclease SbcCD nuclease subunit
MTKKLRKGAYFTDIHFGKKANSQLHNEDCINFIDWFCKNALENGCDYVAFLGDWNENRSALNIATLNYSYEGAKKLNDLGLPVFFCVGNHDLYHRHTRELHSVVNFQEFDHFTVIDQPLVVDNIGDGALFSPYMFHDEYPGLTEHLKLPFWAGHFEFQGFLVTGYNIKMQTGPDPRLFKGPKHIISGHFHRRQEQDNIVYMGNTFPMDFGDAGDNKRGMMIYDHDKQKIKYIDWADAPKYIKTKLTDILDGDVKIVNHARVRCLTDVPISFEESTYLRAKFIEEIAEALADTETSVDVENKEITVDSVDELVVQMLKDIKSDHIDNDILVEQYRAIQI